MLQKIFDAVSDFAGHRLNDDVAMAFLEGAVVSNAGTMIRERAPAIELLAVPMALAVVGLVRRARARP